METADVMGVAHIMNRWRLKHGFYVVFLSRSCIFPQPEQIFYSIMEHKLAL